MRSAGSSFGGGSLGLDLALHPQDCGEAAGWLRSQPVVTSPKTSANATKSDAGERIEGSNNHLASRSRTFRRGDTLRDGYTAVSHADPLPSRGFAPSCAPPR